jgi:exodeoxyribonuclease VII large subunit
MQTSLKVLTVSELTFAIKEVIEPNFRGISVQGEISNFKAQSSGHLYFSMKDANAQISAVLFKGSAANLTRMPKEGDQVIAKGEISLYAPRGQYQIIIRELQFLGLGELLLKFHQLKENLAARGWFAIERKKPLPKIPKRIGVVTSPTGAVIQDILNILNRRFAGFQILLNPVKVQGEGAAGEIAQAIIDFNKYNLADVLIVGRGGGSIEDLWAFNEEIVAKAIFESRIPIISAVGHETDFTIADWVADVRAPTPSAAAEIVTLEKSNLIKFIVSTRENCKLRIKQLIQAREERLKALQRHPLFTSPYALLAQFIQQLDMIRSSLEVLKPSNQITQFKERLAPYEDRISQAILQLIRQKKEKLQRLMEHLTSINPQNLLKKGYSILFKEKGGSIILSVKDLSPHQKFTALLHDGSIEATVNLRQDT